MEIWKNIEGFPGYQISNHGNVRSFWRKKHYETGYGTYRYLSDTPVVMSASDDGNGYLKVMLYADGRRVCKKVHRLVAEAFVPRENEYDDTVDHIRSGRNYKTDNRADNLRWISRRENIQKAYRDGICDERIRLQNKSIIATDLWTGKELYFSSIKEAAYALGVDRTSISHVLVGDQERTRRYTFEYANWEDDLLYGSCDY